jgi:putative endonuclease
VSSTRVRGQSAEDRAAELLEASGLTVVDRNFAAAGAELDLIASSREDGEPMVVFVEVRSRANAELGHPLETVDRTKQAKLVRAATAWLVAHDLWEQVAVRFDVIAIVGADSEVVWIKSAFET